MAQTCTPQADNGNIRGGPPSRNVATEAAHINTAPAARTTAATPHSPTIITKSRSVSGLRFSSITVLHT